MHMGSDYFGEEVLGKKDVVELLHSSRSLNLAGKRIVSLAIREGLGSKLAVKKVNGTPFLMVF